MRSHLNFRPIGMLLFVSICIICTLGVKTPKNDHNLDFIRCVLRPGQKRLSILPGSGWDNLVNEERGLTTNRETYTLCRSSADGNYLLPDDIFLEPLRSSQIELSSQTFSHFTNYTSLTSFSMNVGEDVSFFKFSIGGDFSFEKERVRNAENSNKGLIMRSQLRHRSFVVHQMPDSQLHPRFRNRLLDIAAHLERSNISSPSSGAAAEIVTVQGRSLPNFGEEEMFKMMDSMRAAYLADLIVRDFGTHTVGAVEAGAVVAKIDSLLRSSRMLDDSDRTKMEMAARASFYRFFKVDNSVQFIKDEKYTDEYEKNVASSFVLSHGGPSLKASEMNLTNWENDIGEKLVAIDRRGRPIYDLITPRALPELSETLTFVLAATIKAAVERYYEANSVVGCLDPTSPAYDGEANVASERCDDLDFQDPIANNESGQTPFGGVYTTCDGPNDLCSRYRAPNLATGSTSCPKGFTAVNLLPPQVRSCAMRCDKGGIFQKPACLHECAVTRAYWCALNLNYTLKPPNSTMDLGFLFGGLYTDTTENPITNAQSCPLYYTAQQIGRRIQVCVSTDREFGGRYSMAFGGFYACQSGNPLYDVLSLNKSSVRVLSRLLAGVKNELNNSAVEDDPSLNWPKQCPNGYTSHVAAIEETCLVNYCVPGNSLKVAKDRRLRRPPFIKLPEFSNYDLKADVKKALNEPLRLVDDISGRSYHSEEGNWVEDPSNVKDTSPMKVFAIIGIVCCVCIGILIIVGIALLILKIRNACRRKPINGQSTTASEQGV